MTRPFQSVRIAIFHNLPSGGAKRAVYEWTRRLVRAHRVDVYTLATADHGFCDVRPLVQRHEQFDFVPARLFKTPIGRLNELQRWRDLGRLVSLSRNIARRIDAGGYDVVLANTCLITTVPVVLQFLETPAVYYLHEPVGRAQQHVRARRDGAPTSVRTLVDRVDPLIRLYRRRLDALQFQSMRAATILLANSQFTQATVQRAYGLSPRVSRLGVDAETFRPCPGSRGGTHVFSVGELSPRKGFDFLVEALSLIPQDRRPGLRLASNMVIAEEREYVERLAAERRVTLQIVVGLNTAALVQEYNRAALCVYAPVREPFGLVPLEAMACETPVVGVREGGVPESVVHERTGLLVDRDPARFAAAVELLLSKPSLVAGYGRTGREHVLAHWTWDRSVAELARHLESSARAA